MYFKFCTHIHRIDQNKSPLKISEKVAVGVLRDSRNFQDHKAHRAVTFAIAQLSCLLLFCIKTSVGFFFTPSATNA